MSLLSVTTTKEHYATVNCREELVEPYNLALPVTRHDMRIVSCATPCKLRFARAMGRASAGIFPPCRSRSTHLLAGDVDGTDRIHCRESREDNFSKGECKAKPPSVEHVILDIRAPERGIRR